MSSIRKMSLATMWTLACLLSGTAMSGSATAADNVEAAAGAGAVSDARAASGPADTVFVNGLVYTIDSGNHVASALAVRDGIISYVGDDAGAAALIGKRTRRIDLGGRMLMPGLIDGHMHPQSGGLRLMSCSLDYLSLTTAEFQSRIQACLDADHGAGPDDWFRVINWFEPGALPTGTVLSREVLDALHTTRPILVHSSYGHSDLVNTRALTLAGITRDTPNPKDGLIAHDAKGEPTGILEDAAQDLVDRLLPKTTPAQNLNATRMALAAMRKQGITSFLDAHTDEETLQSYSAVQKAGELSARAHFAVLIDSVPGYDPARAVAEVLATRKRYDQGPMRVAPSMQVDTAKMFLDGVHSAPSYTGILLQPYFENRGTEEHPDWRPGKSNGPDFYFTPAQLLDTMRLLADAGITPHMHADDEGAVREALDAIAALRKERALPNLRPALAHAETVDPDDYPRFAALDAVPVLSFQWEDPAADVSPPSANYLGPVRLALIEPAGLLALYDAPIAYGSDWPVDALDHWLALQVAVTRTATGDDAKRFPGRLGIDPGLSIQQALRAITMGSAYSLHQERETGSLEVGKFADLIVLDQNVLQVAPEKIGDTHVLLTMVGGKIVHEAMPR